MSSAKYIEELLNHEVEQQKKKAESKTMTEYFNKLLPSEVEEVARRSARRQRRVLRRNA